MNKNDLRVIKTKNTLQQALLYLLNEKPLDKIKISEICKLANVNRGTFYLHYGEVADLFREFFQEIMADLKQSYEAPYKNNTLISVSTLNPQSIRIFHHIQKYEAFYRIVFSENVPLMYYYMLLEQISFNISNGNEQHEKKVMRPFAVAYQSNAILGLVIEWYKNDFAQSVDEMNNCLVEILNSHR